MQIYIVTNRYTTDYHYLCIDKTYYNYDTPAT